MLTALRLSRFRCYDALRWDIPAEGAVLLGGNAQGKTSLLEALCFALSLHSPRAARLDRLAQHGSKGFGLSLDSDEGCRRITWETGKKLALSIDGFERRDYADFLTDASPVTWLGNADMELVIGAAERRRNYLDFLGAQWHPAYRQSLQAYRKALKSRNALLRHPRHSRAGLDSYAALLAEHGEQLIVLRRRLLELLQPHITQHHRAIAAGEEQVAISYLPSAKGELYNLICAATESDERSGFTTVGPHRDDIQLSVNAAPAAHYASEGQQRTLATALLLAQNSLLQEETGRAPILLIDDIFGELDPERRRALLARLPDSAQVFITTTHLDWLQQTPCPLPVLQVSNGEIQRHHGNAFPNQP